MSDQKIIEKVTKEVMKEVNGAIIRGLDYADIDNGSDDFMDRFLSLSYKLKLN